VITIAVSNSNLSYLFKFELSNRGDSLIEWSFISVDSYQDRIIALVRNGAEKEIFFRWKSSSDDQPWEPVQEAYGNRKEAYDTFIGQDTALGRIKLILTQKSSSYYSNFDYTGLEKPDSERIVMSMGVELNSLYYGQCVHQIDSLLSYLKNPKNYLDEKIDIKKGKVCHALSGGKPKFNICPMDMVQDTLNMISPLI
jgi:hypothetical protein